jgi:Na+-driven multidrug efflux pump
MVVMLVCALMNVILDPIMIYGLLGFPAMGLAGAALATVISRAAGMATTLSFVHFHHHLLDFHYRSPKELVSSWLRILHVGIPATLIQVSRQVLRAVLTRLSAAVGGVAAVAAVAAGARIEGMALIVSMAVGTAVVPIIGQNWGRGRLDRVSRTRTILNRAAVLYGLFFFLAALFLALPVAGVFSTDPQVVSNIRWYVWIGMIGIVGLNLSRWTSSQLTAAGKPRWVFLINAVGTLVVLIPLSVGGAVLLGFRGMLGGLCLGQLILGLVAVVVGRSELAEA